MTAPIEYETPGLVAMPGAPEGARPRPGLPAVAEAGAKILIVDDHPANLLALEAILAPLGHDVVKASSGEEALRQTLKREFAVILLDVHMGTMGGFETAGLLKQHPRTRGVPIIFVSAVSRDSSHVFRGYSEGAVDYLVKPIDPDILRSKVSVFIDLYLKGEKIKAQERQLREQERESLRRRNEERYRQLLDAMPQCIWAANAAGQVNYWNRAGVEYCGLGPGAITEAAFWACLHPDDREGARATWASGVTSDQQFERQVRLRRASDGAYRWHLARAVPERGDDGRITGWIASATDIDEEKRAEDALREAVALRDDFLSIASHELRTPLTSLRLEVSNLARITRKMAAAGNEPDATKLAGKVTRIDGQAVRLQRLIDELLDVGRLASGRLELELGDVDLAAVTRDVCQQLAADAERIGCPLNVLTPPTLVGQSDRSRLEQVVAKLVSNAVKYGERKPVDVTLAEVAGPLGPVARLTVRDHGIGIAADDRERIFGRFERAASSRHYGGMGLGLWIVKQIAEALGGEIGLESEPGTGSTFTIDLPLSPLPRSAEREVPGAFQPSPG